MYPTFVPVCPIVLYFAAFRYNAFQYEICEPKGDKWRYLPTPSRSPLEPMRLKKSLCWQKYNTGFFLLYFSETLVNILQQQKLESLSSWKKSYRAMNFWWCAFFPPFANEAKGVFHNFYLFYYARSFSFFNLYDVAISVSYRIFLFKAEKTLEFFRWKLLYVF